MAVCDVCGKTRLAGRHIRHKASGRWALRAQKKPRWWRVNVQRKHLIIDGRARLLNICTRCLRTLSKSDKAA